MYSGLSIDAYRDSINQMNTPINNSVTELTTERLKLRQWKASDLPIFAQMNADPQVMEYYPGLLSAQESDAMAQRLSSLIDAQYWGLWAVEVISNGEFIGFVGLHRPTVALPVTPCVEVGWRLRREFWGQGYALEAANASLKFAFEELKLQEVFSFTSVTNQRSIAVMARLNMHNLRHNFEHPMIPKNHPLSEHVLYRITAEQWRNG